KQHDNGWIIDLVHQNLAGDALRWHAMLPKEVQSDWYRLQQALLTQFPIVFRGIDGVECDSFVRHVRRKAVDEGKLQDPVWMANNATGAFAGDALRWYDTLDKETKGNWDLLQTALFERYPASDMPSPLSQKRGSTERTDRVPALGGLTRRIIDSDVESYTDTVKEFKLRVGMLKKEKWIWVAEPQYSCFTNPNGTPVHVAAKVQSELAPRFVGSWLAQVRLFPNEKISSILLLIILSTDKLVFRGTDTNDSECEEFIEAVRRFAFDQGKQHDNQWIVDLVHKSLAGDALRWHITLPQEVQSDWYLLQQALITQFPVVFRGIDDAECDSFVRHVRRKAVNEGKLQDPVWMANYAAGAFAGNALRWYDTLDKETKGSWDLLQTALFGKYPESEVQRPISHFTGKSERQGNYHHNINGPDTCSSARVNHGPEFGGHVSRYLQNQGRHTTTKLAGDRLRVSLVASGNLCRLKLVNSTAPYEYLGLRWSVDKPDLKSKENQHGGLVAASDPDSVRVDSSEVKLSGPIACLLWEVSPDGLLAPVWEGAKLRIGMDKPAKWIWFIGNPWLAPVRLSPNQTISTVLVLIIISADKLVFRGTDTTDSECEDFIEAVRQLAFAQGKQRDNEWIIDLVHKSLAGDALRWHAMLPQEIQNDWYRLQQALLTQFPLIFRGIDGVECDSFVRHVRRKAVNEGKLQDSGWMANYAAGAFAGDALRWYDTLDKETKGNWDLLQTALFEKYPGSDAPSPLSHFTRQG
ncbi:hypothetical protein FRB99_001004, partial [Tulasnella sp. 403]